MERIICRERITCIVLLLIVGVVASIHAQQVESKAVRFSFGNTVDNESPVISIHAPALDSSRAYVTDEELVEVIGEVKDASKIRFISVNNDVKLVDATGLFASTLHLKPGENVVRMKSMDEHGLITEVVYTIDYQPPVVTLADRINRDSKYYALIIGIEDYQDPRIPDLDNPVYDAQSVYRALLDNYTFDRENMKLLKNPIRSEVIWELDALRGKVTENDNLLIFYAGHGYWDEDAEIGYWLPADARQETTADWFRNSALVDYLQAIRTRHTLLITDACFAGSIFKSRSVNLNNEVLYDRIYDLPSRKAMTSGSLTEVPDKSAFVKYLVKRLNENEGQYLSSEELFHSFRMAVISNSSTDVLPQYGEIQNVGNEGGDFVFLRRKTQ